MKDSDVTLLIGTDHADLLLHKDIRQGQNGEPTAVKTTLGWVLMGGSKSEGQKGSCNFVSNSLTNIDERIQNFWKLDSYGTLPKMSPELLPPNEKRTLEILQKTTIIRDNHIETGLLWKKDEPVLPYNRILALNRFHSLEKKFRKNPDFANLYSKQIDEYISLGHARKLSLREAKACSEITNYIPHHGVLNINKPGKVRVVFDASAKFQNTSLNDNLLPGIDLLNNLISVLLRFREGRYAVIADIEKMFHQIRVNAKDTNALRFLWRVNPQCNIEDYIMLVHVFGKVDSPCCANWALRNTSIDSELDVKNTIERNFYMDDFLKSLSNVDDLINLSKRVMSVLQCHGFRLTKWMSNSPEILHSLPTSEISTNIISLDLNTPIVERALGMIWNINQDALTFKPVTRECPNTK